MKHIIEVLISMSWTQFFPGLNVSPTNLAEKFKEENKPKLHCVVGNVMILRDSCKLAYTVVELCWLLPQIEQAVHEYVASRNFAADHTWHSAMGTQEDYGQGVIPDVQDTNATKDYMDAITFSSTEGNTSNKLNRNGTLRIKGCIIGHYSFAARMGKGMKDIKPWLGPLPSYKSKVAIEALRALFYAIFPEEYPKYMAVYGTIYKGRADNIDAAFGIWISC
ncbi:hypothetical protein HOY80DRAFT_997181 [Tuber brumale]|nr:hypothetical protein HOY80DRAFT_997181 [Tuber brumale]